MSILLKAITDSETTLMIQPDALLPVPAGVIQLEDEQIAYTSNYMGTLYGCVRGVNSTSPTAHAIGTLIVVPDFYHSPSAGEITASDIDSQTATDGQVLTADGAGNATWEDAAGGGATTELDNLTATAINADLIPDTNNTYVLGTAATAEWAELNVANVTHNDAGNSDLNIGIGSGTGNLVLATSGGTVTTNAPIVPTTDNTVTVGTDAKEFGRVWTYAVSHADNTNHTDLVIEVSTMGAGNLIHAVSGSGVIQLKAGGNIGAQIDQSNTTGNTHLLLWDVDSGALQRVSVGAADSGGSGFKVLRIPN